MRISDSVRLRKPKISILMNKSTRCDPGYTGVAVVGMRGRNCPLAVLRAEDAKAEDQGHAPAGGCLIAMSCEYRTMVNGKYGIGLNETALGLVAPWWFQDTMFNTIPQREAEMALISGRMFTVDEALKVGLIDELASDKADAIEKCRSFIKNFDKISPLARNQTKLKVRGEPLERLLKNRQADLEEFKQMCLQPQAQKTLGMYIEMLKKKAAKKA